MTDTKRKNVGRPQTEYDEEELNEIINLAIDKMLEGRNDKITYNKMVKFNKEIANNKDYKRSNGELFKLYGYNFWAVKDIGRKLVDEAKGVREVIAAGEAFVIDIKDIQLTIDKYYNNKTQLTKKMVDLFESNKKKAEVYKSELEKAKNLIEDKDKQIYALELGMATMFYNSYLNENSLEDIASLSNREDRIVYDEIKNAFNNNEGRISKFFDNIANLKKDEMLQDHEIINNKTEKLNTVISLEERERERKLLEEEGWI